MDAFEKLAKLAGASVESVGEGLPRTRAEALALGVTKYFTGKPCKRGHAVERWASSKNCYECNLQNVRRHNATPEVKEWMRQYRATPQAKKQRRQYQALPEQKERKRLYQSSAEYGEYRSRLIASPEYKEYRCQFNLAKTGDAVLFSINQAELAASHERVVNDITPQCPEPQRSQLQALVDRIKVDPQAGKAVVGLLRTMRELRKVELAEMKAMAEGGAT